MSWPIMTLYPRICLERPSKFRPNLNEDTIYKSVVNSNFVSQLSGDVFVCLFALFVCLFVCLLCLFVCLFVCFVCLFVIF
jgi:hypothetical protein